MAVSRAASCHSCTLVICESGHVSLFFVGVVELEELCRNHAQNAYMLHALGITHVVSVGECALVPPANIATDDSSSGYHLVAGRGPGGHGSLWMEEREGRIKVLDIKGVCDDGIDSLQHQLAPVCEWMEKAREEGGKILVHCRVGVSRSATVTVRAISPI